jgi:phage-related protein
MTLAADLQGLNLGNIITLFEFDPQYAPNSGITSVVHSAQGSFNVVWNNTTYSASNLSLSGVTVESGGSLQTPTLNILHNKTGRFFVNLLTKDLRGLKVTRYQIPMKYVTQVTRLDGSLAYTGTSPSTDPSVYKKVVFYIDGVQTRDGSSVTYNLAVAPGLDDLNASGNRTLSGTQCNLKYRVWNITNQSFDYTAMADGGCPWAQAGQQANYPNCGSNWGTPYFDANDNLVTDPAKDVCGLGLTSCLKRFPVNPAHTNPPDPLPIQISLKSSG